LEKGAEAGSITNNNRKFKLNSEKGLRKGIKAKKRCIKFFFFKKEKKCRNTIKDFLNLPERRQKYK
jgi:hypothetical protein